MSNSVGLVPPRGTKCMRPDEIQALFGSIVENPDGTVSVYTPDGPVQLTAECCRILNPSYSFDINTQKCKWGSVDISLCAIDTPFLITLNPNGNDGSLFNIAEDEDCFLDINFDYVIKLKCENLSPSITGTGLIGDTGSDATTSTTSKISNQESICENIANEIAILQNEIINTSYSIVCDSIPQAEYVVDLSGTKSNNFGKTGFGVAPFSYVGDTYADPAFTVSGEPATYCLTEPEGLRRWSAILGTRYNKFLAGDPTSYTCADVAVIVAENNVKNTPKLIFECSTPFGKKTELINRLSVLLKEQELCSSKLLVLDSELGDEILNQPRIDCNDPTDILESLDISLILEIVSGTSLVTIAEFPLFPYTDTFGPIGAGNLYSYLTGHSITGFYTCGDSDGECIPLTLETLLNPNSLETNADSCERLVYGLLSDLFVESGLGALTQANIDVFTSTLPPNPFSSTWLHYSNLITDTNIIDAINGQKIKFSIKVNSTCGNFCVLIDDIKLNKTCTVVKSNNLFVSQSPGFTLERIGDNKKSWINNTTPVNRPFDIRTNVDTNIIRETNYDVNDERLVINTKEIDLDIVIASAIEQDVFCYIQDNPCLLDCSTGTTSVTCETDLNFSGMLATQMATCTSNTACTATTVWGITVLLDCQTIYNNDNFFTGLTTDIPNSPTQALYVDELNNIAIALGLEFTSGATSVTFTDTVDCEGIRFLGKNFRIDMSLEVTSCCEETKLFQDGENFIFQNGIDYDFN